MLAANTDVLVVGGGSAGFGAAVAAVDAGAEVVLVERYGFLGGNATVALVMPLMSFHNERKQAVIDDDTRILPTDHGEGDPVVAGVLGRLLARLTATGGAVPPSPDTGCTVPFDPEQLKQVMLDEVGVQVWSTPVVAPLSLERGEGVADRTTSDLPGKTWCARRDSNP